MFRSYISVMRGFIRGDDDGFDLKLMIMDDLKAIVPCSRYNFVTRNRWEVSQSDSTFCNTRFSNKYTLM